MLPGNNRVSTKVKPVVMPTIEPWPTASKASSPLEPADSSRLDVMPGHVRKDMTGPQDAPTVPLPANDKPAQAAIDEPATMATATVPLESAERQPTGAAVERLDRHLAGNR